MNKKIMICEYHQESNNFNPLITEKQRFYPRDISKIENFKALSNKLSVVGGIATSMDTGAYTYCGSVSMRSGSGGPVSEESVKFFIDESLAVIEREKPEGIIVSFHGATVSASSDDVCGDIAEAFRKAAGEDTVIGAAFDLHANITEKMMKNADYVCGYQTYPHVDFYNTGFRTAEIMKRKLSGEKLYAVYASVPVMAPAHAYTTGTGGLKKLMDKAEGYLKSGKITDYTVFQVQPWLDVAKIASVISVIAADEKTAKDVASELARDEFDLRAELQGEKQVSVEEVIDAALKNDTGKPVVMADAADSPNAGATGDCAEVIGKILPYADRLAAAVCVADVPAVEKLFAAGVGARVDIELGGTVAPELSRKVLVKNALVKSLHTGEYICDYPHFKGIGNIGKAAVLKVGKTHILVAYGTHGSGNLEFYGGFGINPRMCDLVSVKTCTSFRAGYAPIAAKIFTPATPGAAGTVLTKLPYKKLPKPVYPFNETKESDIKPAKAYR